MNSERWELAFAELYAELSDKELSLRDCIASILKDVATLRREGIEDLAALQLWCDAVILNTETEYGITLDGAE